MMKWVVLIAAFWTGAAIAQSDTAAAARRAVERLESAADLLEVATTRADRVAALTETVQAYEAGLVALREGLRRASIRRQSIEADLSARSEDVSRLLGALQSMGQAPTPLLLLHPAGPLGTARSGMIIADVAPALQAQVQSLNNDLTEIQDLQKLQGSAAIVLQQGLDGAREARLSLTQAISERSELPRRFTEDPVRTALLMASTRTLGGFANGLADIVDTELSSDVPDATALRGSLPLPVRGIVLRGYNEPDAASIVRPGWIIAARPRALVTTPVAVTVRYQGPLLDYGNVMILEPAADVLFVVAGLAEVFGETGQILPPGSPIGMMGGDQPPSDAILTENGGVAAGSQTETLYLEVREGQSAIDPAVWFAEEG